jgi:hypothetical protein
MSEALAILHGLQTLGLTKLKQSQTPWKLYKCVLEMKEFGMRLQISMLRLLQLQVASGRWSSYTAIES